MDALPFRQQKMLTFNNFCDQPPHSRALYADRINGFWLPVRPEEIDLRLPSAGKMDVCRLMIEGVDDEAKTVSAMDHDHLYL